MRAKHVLILALCCCCLLIKAQSNYVWPLKGQFPLTGNYGEIRPNHFHMGLDLSTQNKENFPVLAIADGYVSRLRISSVGYGKSIYITHPDGHLSLYAHLNKFEEPLASYISKIMLEQKVNEIDFTVPENALPVQKGRMIGLSGNTGGSSGPHLHFEIRDTKSEIPLNPLLFYGQKDVYAPIFNALAFYNLSDSLQPVIIPQKLVKPKKQNKDSVWLEPFECNTSILGLAFDAFDLLERDGNENQIAKVSLVLDSVLIYRHNFSQLQFDDARYVNEFSDKKANQKFQKCFLPEQFPSGLHDSAVNRGRIILSDTLWHKYQLRLSDEAGNTKLLLGMVKTKRIAKYNSAMCESGFLKAGVADKLNAGKFSFIFPAKALYNSVCLYTKAAGNSFTIIPSDINLHIAIKVAINDSSLTAAKRVLTNGAMYAAPKLQNDSVYFDVKSLGAWRLEKDTVGPQLQAKFPKGKHAAKAKVLRFVISDKKSGIGGYDLYLNDTWVPVYYAAKSSQLIFELDNTVPKGNLQFKLQAKDKCGNTSTLKATFKRL